ncbi:MAG: hypothetical protein O3A29_03600 [Planctomycetota bacterium]|nr:hypothetical protein [Planctomycetota bacterium]
MNFSTAIDNRTLWFARLVACRAAGDDDGVEEARCELARLGAVVSFAPPLFLAENFADGRRFLVIVGDRVFLAEKSAKFRKIAPGVVRFLAIDLAELWTKFARLTENRDEFDMAALAKICDKRPTAIGEWRSKGIVPALPVDASTAFSLCLFASLRRYRVSEPVARKAARFVRGEIRCR